MALSSLSVVGNANRLRGWRPGPLPPAAPAELTPIVESGPKTPHHPHQEATMPHDHAPASAIDPICGMTVTPEGAAATREHEGTTYYFCSQHCATTFDAEPDRYTAAATDN
jgi:Cu+-exporting ATPase